MRTMRILATVLCCGSFAACSGDGGSSSPSAPTPAMPATPTPAPAAPVDAFSVDLPVAPGDTANNAYGIWPFGVHGASHAFDGHPGFDVEFRVGASVRAAADGTIAHLLSDSSSPGRYTIRITHKVGDRSYATDYTNVGTPAAGIASGAAVTRGQPLGLAGVQSQFIGSSPVTWAMTHFQVNDFSRMEGLTNPNAVGPETLLSASSQALFESMWSMASYSQELTEPLSTNDRNAVFPLTRAWTTTEGGAPERLDITRADGLTVDQSFVIRSAAGDAIESGTVAATPRGGMSTIDLLPRTGARRLGVYDIVGRTMRLSLAAPGAARPTSLAGAATYTTIN